MKALLKPHLVNGGSGFHRDPGIPAECNLPMTRSSPPSARKKDSCQEKKGKARDCLRSFMARVRKGFLRAQSLEKGKLTRNVKMP